MHDILLIAVAAVVTAATRFIPFLIFRKKDSTPAIVTYLGQVLPCAIMGMLVVYCMKDVPFFSAPFGAPEIIGCVIVALLHIWKRNSLLSIGVGTVSYMLMVQLIF
jgi:branched-subunit amino acid transport protein AzlD